MAGGQLYLEQLSLGCLLILHQGLHCSTSTDERSNKTGQDSLADLRTWRLRNLLFTLLHNTKYSHGYASAIWPGTHLNLKRLHSRKINVVFLDDTQVQRPKVHDEDVLVPQAALRVEYETALVLVPLALGCLLAVAVFLLLFQIYLRRWNSCRRMYSFRSARPPLRVLFLRK